MMRSRATTARLFKAICVGTARLNKQKKELEPTYKNRKFVKLLNMNYAVHSLQFLAKKIFCEQNMHTLAALSKVGQIEDLVVAYFSTFQL